MCPHFRHSWLLAGVATLCYRYMQLRSLCHYCTNQRDMQGLRYIRTCLFRRSTCLCRALRIAQMELWHRGFCRSLSLTCRNKNSRLLSEIGIVGAHLHIIAHRWLLQPYTSARSRHSVEYHNTNLLNSCSL